MADAKPKSLHEALAKFQADHHSVKKDGSANYGDYPTLASGLLASQPAAVLGLSHTQTFDYLPTENGKVHTILITTLKFSDSDEKIESKLILPELQSRGNIMQALGSAITYARRYALLAIYGLAGADDDGEESAGTILEKTPIQNSTPPVKSSPPKTVIQKKPIPAPNKSLYPKQEINRADFIKPERLVRIKAKLADMWQVDQDEVLLAFKLFKEKASISADRVTIANVITEQHGDILEPLLGMANDT